MMQISRRFLALLSALLFAILFTLNAPSPSSLRFYAHSNSHMTTKPLPEESSLQPSLPHLRPYQRDYFTLWTYTASLVFVGAFFRFNSMIPHKTSSRHPSIYQPYLCRWRQWTSYEGSWWSMPSLIRLTLLIGFNLVILMIVTVRQDASSTDAVHSMRGQRDLYYQGIANRCAQLALVNFTAAVALSVRHSLLFAASMDTRIQWHTVFSHVGGIALSFHATYQLNRNYQRHDHLILPTLFSKSTYLTGSLMGLAVVTLIFGSHPLVRALSYRLFRITHITAFVGLVLLGCWHHWTFVIFYAAVIAFWCVDHTMRLCYEYQPSPLVLFQSLSGNVVKLQVKSSFKAVPGQFVYLSWSNSRVERWLHAHPFSISRIDRLQESHITHEIRPDDDDEHKPSSQLQDYGTGKTWLWTFHIKASGQRTTDLLERAQAMGAKDLTLRTSRPVGYSYLGIAGRAWNEFGLVVLVAEGIGITPWIAVLQALEQQPKPTKLILIWTVRSQDLFTAFADALEPLSACSHLDVRIHLFVTQSTAPDLEYGTTLHHPHVHVGRGRPDYDRLLNDIQSSHTDTDVALGLCAHAESIRQCGNLARSPRFSHGQAQWFVLAHRFQFA